MKKFLRVVLVLLLGFYSFASFEYLSAEEPQINVFYFFRESCKHCQDEEKFWEELDSSQVNLIQFDVEKEGNKDFLKVTAKLGIPRVTPLTIIGDRVIQGFDSSETTGVKIKGYLEEYRSLGYSKSLDETLESISGISLKAATCDEDGLEPCDVSESVQKEFSVPVILGGGTVDISKYSLPGMALVLGFIDGFNPCAMWVLIMFLILLIDAGSIKKMITLAGLFIVAEAVMYYLILNVWYSAWNFIGLNQYVTPFVGVVSIGAGIWFLYEFWFTDGTCKVIGSNARVKTRSRLKKLVDSPLSLLTILGILGVAFSVNIFEFVCSIGIPQAFTKILELNGLSFFEYQFYMLIYILAYMIDDLIVFGIAIWSFERIGITTKYTKISHLIGGILMLILGIIMLTNPELLVL